MTSLCNNIHGCEFLQWMEDSDTEPEGMSRLWEDESYSKEGDTGPRAVYIHLDKLGFTTPVNGEWNLTENPNTERAVCYEEENMANSRRNKRREIELEH